MKHAKTGRTLFLKSAVVAVFLLFAIAPAWSGFLRINMNDGSSVEVPYYWEEAGQIKFEIPGGVAGVPKGQVSSVQEVLAAKEFDPEVLLEAPKDKVTQDQQRMLEAIVSSKTSPGNAYQKVSDEESRRLLKLAGVRQMTATRPEEQIFGPNYKVEGDYAELVRTESGGVMLLLRKVLSSRSDLHNQSFQLTLYDGEGSVLLRKPCQVQMLDVDPKDLRKMEIRGNLYAVTGTVSPDPSIKRYEITSVSR